MRGDSDYQSIRWKAYKQNGNCVKLSTKETYQEVLMCCIMIELTPLSRLTIFFKL